MPRRYRRDDRKRPTTRKAIVAGVERVRAEAHAWLDRSIVLGHLPPPRRQPEPTYSRPPRRQPELAGIVPGHRQVARPPILLVAIDVSSSMSSTTLGWIKQEVPVQADLYRVALVEIDTRVVWSLLLFDGRHHAPSLVDDVAHGRGGTALDAAFTPDVLA